MTALTDQDLARELSIRMGGSDFFEFAEEWGPEQREALVATTKFIFGIGGNSSGKTEIGAYSVAMRIYGFNPLTGHFYRAEPGRDYQKKPYCMYVVGTGEPDVEQRLKPRILNWLPKDSDSKLYKTDSKTNSWIALDGTWVIFFKSINQGPRAHQGDEVDFVWCDEDPENRLIWDEWLARTGRRLGQILITMTAWQGCTWLYNFMRHPDEYPAEHKIACRIPLDKNPYFYLCDCGHSERKHVDGCCRKPGCVCAKYNPSRGQQKLDEYRRAWHGIMHEIRFNGHYLLMAGRQVIAPNIIEGHLDRVIEEESRILKPPLLGFFNERTQFVNVGEPEYADPRSIIRVSKLPEAGVEYTIGVDTGGGNPTGDYHAAVVIDDETGDQCALLHTRSMEPRDLAWPLIQLGTYYNEAFIVPEANNVGQSMIDKMMELGYANIYVRRILEQAGTAKSQKKTGFWTDKKTKYFAVSLFVDLVSNHWKVHDRVILDELFGILWLKENREGFHGIGPADADGHDDIFTACFCAAIGWHHKGIVMAAQDGSPLPPPPPKQDQVIEAIEKDLAREQEQLEQDQEQQGFDPFQEELFGQMGGDDLGWDPDNIGF